jgi:hypothetical protein
VCRRWVCRRWVCRRWVCRRWVCRRWVCGRIIGGGETEALRERQMLGEYSEAWCRKRSLEASKKLLREQKAWKPEKFLRA